MAEDAEILCSDRHGSRSLGIGANSWEASGMCRFHLGDTVTQAKPAISSHSSQIPTARKPDGLYSVAADTGARVTLTCFGILALPNYGSCTRLSSLTLLPQLYAVIIRVLT